MKPKSLLPLVVILVVLGVLIGIKKTRQTPPGFVEQVGLVALLPDGLAKGDLAKLELYVGAKPDDKVVLAWNAEGDRWRVETHFGAPVKEDKMDEYLDAVVALQGEFRTTADSEEDLEPFNLTDAKAFHILGYKKDSDTAAFHLLIGSSPGYRTIFMRTENEHNVFVEDTNLRQLAGLYGDDDERVPEADTWLDKQVLDFDKDKIAKVALTSPDKALTFELQPKPKEPAEDEDAESTEEDADDEAAEAAVDEAEVEKEWVLTQGGIGKPHKQSGLDSLLRKLDSLTASGIVDPAKKAEWGLEPPAFTCIVSLEGDPEDVVIDGGWPDPSGDGYVRIANDTEDLVYKLSKYDFGQLWPKGSDLFDLPKLNVDRNAIERIEITQPQGNVVLVKKDDAWTIAEPKADAEPLTTTLDTVARTLATWKAQDFADAAGDRGLDAPERTVTFTTGGGQSHTVALGADAKALDGVYARLDDGELVLAMGQVDVEKVFVAPNDLYDRALFDFDVDDITSVHVRRDEDTFLLERKEDDTWTLVIEGEGCEPLAPACERLFEAVADLEAATFLFGQTAFDGDTAATIGLTRKGGTSHTISLGVEDDGAYPMTLSDKKQAFTIAAADARALLPSANSLKVPEPVPAPEPEASTEEATEVTVELEAAEAPAETDQAEQEPSDPTKTTEPEETTGDPAAVQTEDLS